MANLLAADPQNLRQKWIRQASSKVHIKEPSDTAKNSLHLIRQPGGASLNKFFSPPMRQSRNLLAYSKNQTEAANTTSKKAEQSSQMKQDSQNDYRLILERQRKLIKELHSSKGQNQKKEDPDAQSWAKASEGASMRIHSFLQTHTESPYVVQPVLSPTAQVAAQFQEKHSKALNLTPKKEKHSVVKTPPKSKEEISGRDGGRRSENGQLKQSEVEKKTLD